MQDSSTILIVDDQPSARKVLQGLLAKQGYTLAFAINGQEALSKAIEIAPDLILLDVMMPDMDGFEVCQRLRADQALAEVPIIMITALDDHDSRLMGLNAGADDFISKPFNHVELQARVQSVTRLNRYRRLLLERAQRQEAEDQVFRRNRELTLLNQVIMTAASSLNVQDTLDVACQALADALDLPQATALLFNKDQTKFVTVVRYVGPQAPPKQPKTSGNQIAPTDDILSEEILIAQHLTAYLSEHKAPLALVLGGEYDPSLTQVYDQLSQRGLGLVLIVPILMGDRLIGLFELKTVERFFLGEHDLALAQSVGTTAGRAIETAQLYQSLQRHADVLEETVAQRTAELRSERDRIQAILQALGEAVIITDVSGSIQYLNPAAVALTGFTEAEAKGQNWRLVECLRTRESEKTGADEQLFDEISAMVRTGHTWRGEVSSKRRNGSVYDALLTVAPLFDLDSSEDLIGFVCVQSDITALKEAQRLRTTHQEREKQAALDRLRHTFLSTINHELRTPLALIFQSLEMLEGSQLGEMTAEQADALMALRRQAWTLGRMVEGLTRVAAFLSKQETVRPVLARLDPVLDSVIPLAEFKARSKEIAVETEIASNLPFFPLDVKQMEEALTQLVDNAIKFNQAGGRIRISTQADDDWITVAVSDSGVGIDAEQMNRIWEVFEQGSDPLKRAQEGLGLGLVLARYIVEAHRGTIEIESLLDHGSTVTVKLPRAETSRAGPISD